MQLLLYTPAEAGVNQRKQVTMRNLARVEREKL